MRRSAIFSAFGCALVALAAHAERDLTGTTPDGAYYRIAVPDRWKSGDPLILFQHGLTFEAPGPNPSLGPIAPLQLSEGYAIAASSYRQRAWALFDAPDDNAELLTLFRQQVGDPGSIIPYGGSMGGLVALKLAEDPRFAPVPGVYAACTPAAGSRVWDTAIDLRLAYDVVCKDAGDLPKGDAPYPWAYNLGDIPDNLSDLLDQAQLLQTLLPLNQCTGVDLPDYLRNGAMTRRLNQLMALAHISDENFFVTNVGYATYALGDLVRAPDKLNDLNPFTNIGVDYGDATLNADIARIAADPFAALYFRWASDFHGRVGNAKVLAIQTSRDQLVIPANQYILRQTLPSTQLTSALVNESKPSHCGFTLAEGVGGWEALRAWIATNRQPGVADVQSACTAAQNAGAAGACRYDANLSVPTFDSQVRPRPAATAAAVDARYSGEWYDPARSGEGVLLEVLADGRALLGWFTYPPAGASATQAWFTGVGQLVGNGIEFADVLQPFPDGHGGINNVHWGRLGIVFDDCSHASMRWDGPVAWGSMQVSLLKLTGYQGLDCSAGTTSTNAQVSGAWYDPRHYGSGFDFEQLDAARVALGYFGFDASGNQIWFAGVAARGSDGNYSVDLVQPVGTYFGAAFDPTQVTRQPAGTLSGLDFTGCASASAHLDTSATGSLTLALKRVTVPAGIPACP